MHPLLKLLASNRNKGAAPAPQASADETTLYLYDVIVSDELTAEWMGGIAPQSFVKQLRDITTPKIHLRINSPGGDVFAARAIEQAIREHPSAIVAHVDGYAASAASYIALAADHVVMAPGAFYMIHRAWTLAWGNTNDMLAMADLLDKIDNSLADTYAIETKQSRAQILEWMGAETWFNAQESVDAGFADEIAQSAPKASAQWDLSAYAHAPKVAAQNLAQNEPKFAATHTEHLRRALRLKTA